jgi:hypothetical protein
VVVVIPVDPIEVVAIPQQLTAEMPLQEQPHAAVVIAQQLTVVVPLQEKHTTEVVHLELAVLLVVAVTVVPVPVLLVLLPVVAITAVVIMEVTIMEGATTIMAEVQTSSSVDSSGSLGSLTTPIPMATIHTATPILTRTLTPTLIPLRIRTILT